jgi:diguanylate cyclase (GGDEF)-like protein
LELITKNNIKLDNLAKKDELTGIYNRRGFFIESDSLLANEEEKKKYVVVGFADTDNLKTINDTYGHDEGDLIITESSRILTETLDSRGVIARLGGDEFAFIFYSDRDDEDKLFFKDFEKRVQDYNEKADKPYTLSISLGMNVYEYSENIDLKELLDSADKEMYHIKKKRRNRQ